MTTIARSNRSARVQRDAFTLVELMVVITIIAILVSLLSSAVFKAMEKIPEVQTRTEIAEMAVALEAFQADYNLDVPPPSLLILNETTPLAHSSVDNGRSAQFLQKVFGKELGTQGPVDWNGDGIAGNGPWILQGYQCLTFYLGGIIPNVAVGPQGFSTNNKNPAMLGGKRKGPYFTFQTARLVPATPISDTGGFCVYVDPWQVKTGGFYPLFGGTPYIYFSSYGINNGYNYTDCSGLHMADVFWRPQIPLPYYTAVNGSGVPTAYTNPNTYQIISAGKDGVFGFNLTPPSAAPAPPSVLGVVISNNNLWVPSAGPAPGSCGADDQANFSAGLLGAGQQ